MSEDTVVAYPGETLRQRALSIRGKALAAERVREHHQEQQNRRLLRESLAQHLLDRLGVTVAEDQVPDERGKTIEVDGLHFGFPSDGWWRLHLFLTCEECESLKPAIDLENGPTAEDRGLGRLGRYLDEPTAPFICSDCGCKQYVAEEDRQLAQPRPTLSSQEWERLSDIRRSLGWGAPVRITLRGGVVKIGLGSWDEQGALFTLHCEPRECTDSYGGELCFPAARIKQVEFLPYRRCATSYGTCFGMVDLTTDPAVCEKCIDAASQEGCDA